MPSETCEFEPPSKKQIEALMTFMAAHIPPKAMLAGVQASDTTWGIRRGFENLENDRICTRLYRKDVAKFTPVAVYDQKTLDRRDLTGSDLDRPQVHDLEPDREDFSTLLFAARKFVRDLTPSSDS